MPDTPRYLLLDRPLPGVLRITLHRPQKRNALSNALRPELQLHPATWRPRGKREHV